MPTAVADYRAYEGRWTPNSEPFRTALDLDSRTFVEKLTRATGVRINEADYPHVASIDSCADFLATAG
ncbi:hypothetical protein OIE68_04515 [Nocardia vinacea]|uniref:hypothetical protein n=1 Tax=Nocardia vinacea TaxID=96468 RepID=UPI002E1362D2|nr:hypothetical protein OIE68_04515 [Nocardia vinacea]